MPRAGLAVAEEASAVELRRRRSDQALVPAVDDQLGATANLDLLVDAVQVGLDRALADVEPLGDLPVAQAGRGHAKDVDLANGQELADLARPGLPPQQHLERARG